MLEVLRPLELAGFQMMHGASITSWQEAFLHMRRGPMPSGVALLASVS